MPFLPLQLASMAQARGTAVGGGLETNLSNWLGRFHQISKMREKSALRREDPNPGATPPVGSRTPRTAPHLDGNAAGLLSDFTSYS